MESRQVGDMVHQLVDWYAKTNRAGMYELDSRDIPENDLNNLTALMLSQDDMLASEATGPDNPEWEKSMQPALIRTLKTQKNGYAMEEFHDVWTSGVRAYLMTYIDHLVEERLQELNEDRACHTSLIWDRASEKVVEIRSHG